MFDIPMDLKLLEEEVIALENEPIEKGKILFYGHSLFTRWGHPVYGCRRMDEDIRMKDGSLAVVNHGFGTSSCEELLYYYDRLVRPWAPRALVLAFRGNDDMYGYGPEQTMNVIARLLHWARTDFPGIKLYIVEISPKLKDKSYTGRELWNRNSHLRKQFLEMVHIYADTHEDTKLIELWNRPEFFETPEDVGNYKMVREDIYAADQTHFNQAGYDILREIFLKELDELL